MQDWNPHGQHQCGDCGAREGQIHEYGCDMERCPYCGHQLLGCHCRYKHLGLYDPQRYSVATDYLQPHVYYHGLSETQHERWLGALERKGRIPFILYPNMCGRCGMLWPQLFRVSDRQWRTYIQHDARHLMLCRPCYTHIKAMIVAGKEGEA